LPDSDCTGCHRDLAKNVAEGRTAYANVSGFAAGLHPAFRVRERDPGKLKFNHQLHLSPGMATAAHGNSSWTLARLAAPDRPRYRKSGQTDESLVTLDCTSCHLLDRQELDGKAATAGRSPGATYLPVTYENHCRACHPLTIADGSRDIVTVPHGRQPDELHQWLRAVYWEQYLKNGHPAFLSQFVPPTPVPGRKPGGDEKRLAQQIDEQVFAAEKMLYRESQTCGECHQFTGGEAGVSARLRPAEAPDFEVAATGIPAIWFVHASFSHLAHRAVDCRECHDAAYADSPHASSKSEDVILPSMETCLRCHAPRAESGGVVRGGARFDCTECHTYHHGDQPLEGLAASARGVELGRKLDITRFLSDANGKR
jgi:hypothetical protein